MTLSAMICDQPSSGNDRDLEAALDLRIAEMRAMLIEMQAADTAGALRALREAYPDVPLAERVRALSAVRH